MKTFPETEITDCNRALECLYNLTDMDKKVLGILEKGGEFRSGEIATKLEKDQSTAYRSLEKLLKCGFVYKEKHRIRNGGYYFTYSSRPVEHIKEEALEYLEAWYGRMKRSIEDL